MQNNTVLCTQFAAQDGKLTATIPQLQKLRLKAMTIQNVTPIETAHTPSADLDVLLGLPVWPTATVGVEINDTAISFPSPACIVETVQFVDNVILLHLTSNHGIASNEVEGPFEMYLCGPGAAVKINFSQLVLGAEPNVLGIVCQTPDEFQTFKGLGMTLWFVCVNACCGARAVARWLQYALNVEQHARTGTMFGNVAFHSDGLVLQPSGYTLDFCTIGCHGVLGSRIKANTAGQRANPRKQQNGDGYIVDLHADCTLIDAMKTDSAFLQALKLGLEVDDALLWSLGYAKWSADTTANGHKLPQTDYLPLKGALKLMCKTLQLTCEEGADMLRIATPEIAITGSPMLKHVMAEAYDRALQTYTFATSDVNGISNTISPTVNSTYALSAAPYFPAGTVMINCTPDGKIARMTLTLDAAMCAEFASTSEANGFSAVLDKLQANSKLHEVVEVYKSKDLFDSSSGAGHVYYVNQDQMFADAPAVDIACRSSSLACQDMLSCTSTFGLRFHNFSVVKPQQVASSMQAAQRALYASINVCGFDANEMFVVLDERATPMTCTVNQNAIGCRISNLSQQRSTPNVTISFFNRFLEPIAIVNNAVIELSCLEELTHDTAPVGIVTA